MRTPNKPRRIGGVVVKSAVKAGHRRVRNATAMELAKAMPGARTVWQACRIEPLPAGAGAGQPREPNAKGAKRRQTEP